MKVNIRTISEYTGFSPATVSNALNHKKGVNKDTASEILRAAKELGYIGEMGITKIKLVIYKDKGLIVDDNPFFSLVVDGFEKECREAGYEMALCYLDRQTEDYKRQVENLCLDRLPPLCFWAQSLQTRRQRCSGA